MTAPSRPPIVVSEEFLLALPLVVLAASMTAIGFLGAWGDLRRERRRKRALILIPSLDRDCGERP